jgi:hypothetical protein
MSKYAIEHTDAKEMWEFQMETLKIADEYAEARRGYAKSLKTLKVGLAQAYANNQIEKKHSEDKAYLMLAEADTEFKGALQNLIFFEGEYKGLEQVLEARQGALSFNQSLIKNKIGQT